MHLERERRKIQGFGVTRFKAYPPSRFCSRLVSDGEVVTGGALISTANRVADLLVFSLFDSGLVGLHPWKSIKSLVRSWGYSLGHRHPSFVGRSRRLRDVRTLESRQENAAIHTLVEPVWTLRDVHQWARSG